MLFDIDDFTTVCGADEAGRGPLAGPVCAAAVVLPKNFPLDILGDSKVLSEKRRIEAEKIIKTYAIAWSVRWATAQEIDKINILQASMLAMKRAFLKVNERTKCTLLLVDGNKKPDIDFPCHAIVKGDSKIPEIMAASILAKNARDRLMISASKKYPMYGFEKHKGYPTKAHIDALKKFGPCPLHRKTFHFS